MTQVNITSLLPVEVLALVLDRAMDSAQACASYRLVNQAFYDAMTTLLENRVSGYIDEGGVFLWRGDKLWRNRVLTCHLQVMSPSVLASVTSLDLSGWSNVTEDALSRITGAFTQRLAGESAPSLEPASCNSHHFPHFDAPKVKSLSLRSTWKLRSGVALQTTLPSLAPTVTELNLSNCRWIDDCDATEIARLQNLQVLDLDFTSVSGECLTSLRSLPNLRRLSLNCCGLSDTTFASIGEIQTLETLSLGGCFELSDAIIPTLGKLGRLTNLSLSYCVQFTPAGLATLVNALTSIRILDLSGCNVGAFDVPLPLTLESLDLSCCRPSLITDSLAMRISLLDNLRRVNLSLCDKLTDLVVAALPKSTQSVELDSCNLLTDGCLEHSSKLPELSSVSVSGCALLQEWRLLTLCHQLEELDLSGCTQLLDANLLALSCLKTLTKLSIGGCTSLTDAGLAEIPNLPMLKSFSATNCEALTDRSLAQLANVKGLTALNLQGSHRITDATPLAFGGSLMELQGIDLSSCSSLTDTGIVALGRLRRLGGVDLGRCTRLTDASIKSLAANLSCLTYLSVAGCALITDLAVDALLQVAGLTALDFSNCSKLTDASADAFAGYAGLQVVYCPNVSSSAARRR
jgi:Leucine-rich repeat (LRR) protein